MLVAGAEDDRRPGVVGRGEDRDPEGADQVGDLETADRGEAFEVADDRAAGGCEQEDAEAVGESSAGRPAERPAGLPGAKRWAGRRPATARPPIAETRIVSDRPSM